MKKSLRFIAISVILIMSILVLNSCYVVKSGKMSRIEGTYMLTSYSGDGDYITERGITMYVIIRADGTGYYAYTDGTCDPYIAQLHCRYVQDTEEAGKYSYVEIDFGTGEYVKFAVYAPTLEFKTNLNFTKPVWKPVVWGEPLEIDYNINVDFTRVSRKTDSSYIVENFGKAPVLPYGAKRLDGTYKLDSVIANDKSPEGAALPEHGFVYYYIDFDFVAGKAKIYGMEKSNEAEVTATLDDLSIELVEGEYLLTAGGRSIGKLATEYSSRYLYVEEYFGEDCFTLRFSYWGDMTEEQITDSIEDDVNIYMNSKLPHEE